MRELGVAYSRSNKKGKSWRFIAEDYTDSDFAKSLQNKPFLEDPKEDLKSSISQYVYLFDRANQIYTEQANRLKLSRAISSIVDNSDPKKFAETLRLYEYNKTGAK